MHQGLPSGGFLTSRSYVVQVFGTAFRRNARWSTNQPVPDLGDDALSMDKVCVGGGEVLGVLVNVCVCVWKGGRAFSSAAYLTLYNRAAHAPCHLDARVHALHYSVALPTLAGRASSVLMRAARAAPAARRWTPSTTSGTPSGPGASSRTPTRRTSSRQGAYSGGVGSLR